MDAVLGDRDRLGLPEEMIESVAIQAMVDAQNVCSFLRAVGLDASPESPVRVPGGFLLQLGAALRLLKWETLGLRIHKDAGLPSAKEAIREAFAKALDPAAQSTELARSVMRLSVERLAWAGTKELGIDVALTGELDDAALDDLADFLLANQ